MSEEKNKRGRPFVSAEQAKNVRFLINCTAKQAEEIKRQAKAEGKSVSALMLARFFESVEKQSAL